MENGPITLKFIPKSPLRIQSPFQYLTNYFSKLSFIFNYFIKQIYCSHSLKKPDRLCQTTKKMRNPCSWWISGPLSPYSDDFAPAANSPSLRISSLTAPSPSHLSYFSRGRACPYSSPVTAT